MLYWRSERFNAIQRDLRRFCSEDAGKSIERLVVDEFFDPILDLCDAVGDNTIIKKGLM